MTQESLQILKAVAKAPVSARDQQNSIECNPFAYILNSQNSSVFKNTNSVASLKGTQATGGLSMYEYQDKIYFIIPSEPFPGLHSGFPEFLALARNRFAELQKNPLFSAVTITVLIHHPRAGGQAQ